MPLEDLPRSIAFDLVDLAARIRCGGILELGGGREIELLASRLRQEGLDTRAARELATPPMFRNLSQALPLFHQLLNELQCPSLEEMESWWPESRFEERFRASAPSGYHERFWRSLADTWPSFAAIYDPYETSYFNAILCAREIVKLLQDDENSEKLTEIFSVLEEWLEDSNVDELIVTGILEALQGELASQPAHCLSVLERLLPPELRWSFEHLGQLG